MFLWLLLLTRVTRAKSHKSSWLFSSSCLLKPGKPLLNHCEQCRGTESVNFGVTLVTAVFSNVADVNCQYYHHLWSHLNYLEKKKKKSFQSLKRNLHLPQRLFTFCLYLAVQQTQEKCMGRKN